MQPTIQLERRRWIERGKYAALPFQCIVCCISNSVGFIIIRESPCIYFLNPHNWYEISCQARYYSQLFGCVNKLGIKS
jgi:hypothetical protein